MRLSLNGLGVSVNFSIHRSTQVWGVNSPALDTDQHVLMWDFDGHGLPAVTDALTLAQARHNLSTIFVLQSSDEKHYFAYCFTTLPWPEAVGLIALTPLVDWRWVRLAVVRGYFTLRVTAKDRIEPVYATRLDSSVPADCTIYDLKSWSRYWTHFKRDGAPRDGG